MLLFDALADLVEDLADLSFAHDQQDVKAVAGPLKYRNAVSAIALSPRMPTAIGFRLGLRNS